jgi:hypothetical protein
MSKRVTLAAIVYPMVNAVLFGAGAAAVLTAAPANLPTLLAAVIVASFVLAAPISWLIAPKLSLQLSRVR